MTADSTPALVQNAGVDTDGLAPTVGTPFRPIERIDIAWTYHLTRSALVDLVASRSYVITADAKERVAILDATRDLAENHPALAGSDNIAMPYIARCSRARIA